jgi:DNA mismatch repair protein MutS2
LQLDVRGLRADEAEEHVTRYIDEASLAGMPMVSILHGKGTGALSQVTARVLAGHPLVKDHRFAVPEQGGFGVTVVDLG